ncbi:MAG: hypothetical protein Q3998_02770 [Porphyromonas sp.]|nr:hypothetical protein [Porphyromonas sp.]
MLSILAWMLPSSETFAFTPTLTSIIEAPWSLLTYPFYHKTLLHLGSNVLLLLGVILFAVKGRGKVYLRRPFLYTLISLAFPLFIFTITAILVPTWMGSLSGVSGLALFALGSLLAQYRGLFFYLFLFLGIATIVLLSLRGNSAGHVVHLGTLFLGILLGRKGGFVAVLTRRSLTGDMERQVYNSGYTSLSETQRQQLIGKGRSKK